MGRIYSFFKFLNQKGNRKIPFKVKFIYAPKEIQEEDLEVEGNLDLRNTEITSLPDNLEVGGHLDLENIKITSLPNNLKVGGYLDLENTKITSLPNNLEVGGSLNLNNTPISKKYTEEEIKKMIEDKGGVVNSRIYT